MLKTLTMAGTMAGLLVGLGMASPALAADNAMQVCGAKYRAAKTGKTLPAGQTWPQFLAQCRGTLPKAAAMTTPAPAAAMAKAPMSAPAKAGMSTPAKMGMSAPAKAAATPRVAGQASAAQIASRSRLTQCSKNYQADKAANKLAGQTWPKYYSACNTRLKA